MLKFIHKYADKFVSKWLILILDILICSVSFTLASVLRFNFDLTYINPDLFKYHLGIIVSVKVYVFLYLKSYTGIIRHTSIEDAKMLFRANSLALGILFIFYFINWGANSNKYFHLPISILIIDYFISLFALTFSRLLVKSLYEIMLSSFKTNVNVIIYGAGYLGLMVKNTLLKDKKKKYDILYFIDDNPQKINKTIEGIKVISKRDAVQNHIQYNSEIPNFEVIFAIQAIAPQQKTLIVEEFLSYGVTMKTVPPISQWMEQELSINQIQNIKIEDLLEREPISISNKLVRHFVNGKTILVTGAAGSIGSELVRQLLKFVPLKIILVDQAESPLYDLETELLRTNSNIKSDIRVEVLNITNLGLVEKLFKEELPQVVFHAAAYKHVPLMEKSPYQAVSINIFGTKIMAEMSSKYGVEKFVMVSTDKAVNPTNVMGATKRLAEMYVQGLNSHYNNSTRFIITRFGNVLGSNGSVIPLFKKQIEAGGPITVTHKDIIRYFMTIPEACQLVLEAGTMGKGGEVYVFDMGKPVKIVDLAKKMVQLSGLIIDQDIEIKFTGLRPGEKLFEELLSDNENTLPTYHSKIMIAKVVAEDFDILSTSLKHLEIALLKNDNTVIVTQLKKLIPEYISNNSVYEQLDKLESEESKIL